MKKRFLIHLSADERAELSKLLRQKVLAKFKRQRAQIFLLADEERAEGALPDVQIAAACDCGHSSIERARQDFCERGLAALERKPSKQAYERKFDGASEAKLIALCCGSPPKGQAQWSLRLLADELVELKVFESVSHEAIRRVLVANELKPWLKKQWCIPPLGQRRVRLQHGGRARRLPPPA